MAPPLVPPVPVPVPPEKKPRVGGGWSRNMFAGTMWGAFRITPTANGYQITCTNPKHNDKFCQKTKASNIDGEDTTLRKLKYWAVSGRDMKSQGAHFAHFEKVLQLSKAGELPSSEALESMRIDAWPATSSSSKSSSGT